MGGSILVSTMTAMTRSWSSLVGKGLYLPNCQSNFVIALYILSLLFFKLINTTAYHLGRFKPSSPVSCRASVLQLICHWAILSFISFYSSLRRCCLKAAFKGAIQGSIPGPVFFRSKMIKRGAQTEQNFSFKKITRKCYRKPKNSITCCSLKFFFHISPKLRNPKKIVLLPSYRYLYKMQSQYNFRTTLYSRTVQFIKMVCSCCSP